MEQYRAGGTRWLASHNQELVHFVCQPGTPYRVSLSSVSLLGAGIQPDEQPAYLEALREATRDWGDRMHCPWIRVEMDSPDPDTLVVFTYVDTPGTLAMATRAGDITLNAMRSWFPGSKRQSNYSPLRLQVSFYWVVAHELGHVWGLAHSDDPHSLMYPSQCHTCRWSSFEQAGANVIHAASLTPSWSRPHYTSRFFAKTPVAVIEPLLTGDFPDEALLAESTTCEPEVCWSRERGPDDLLDSPGCAPPDPLPTSSLLGWLELRGLGRWLGELTQARWEPATRVGGPRGAPPDPFRPPILRATLDPAAVLRTEPLLPEARWPTCSA